MVTYSFWLVSACLAVALPSSLRTDFVLGSQPVGGAISSMTRSLATSFSSGSISAVKRLVLEGMPGTSFLAWASPSARTSGFCARTARKACVVVA